MSNFNEERLRKRIWQRHAKSFETGIDLTGEWLTNSIAITGIKTFVEWCKLRSIKVNFCSLFSVAEAGQYDPNCKTITVSSRLMPEKQLFVILHECGHYLIDMQSKPDRYRAYDASDQLKRTFGIRAEIIDEELEAWHRGLKLAERLNVSMNNERFDAFRAVKLRSWFKWALKIVPYAL